MRHAIPPSPPPHRYESSPTVPIPIAQIRKLLRDSTPPPPAPVCLCGESMAWDPAERRHECIACGVMVHESDRT